MSNSVRARMGLGVAIVLAIVLVLLAMACGGGDDLSPDLPIDAPETEPADGDDGVGFGETPEGGLAEAFEETYPVNQTFWYEGFKVELGDAVHTGTAEDVFFGGEFALTVDALFTNEGEDQRRMGSSLALVTPSETYGVGFGTEIPNVPGGVELSGILVFELDEDFVFDEAYLLVGGGDEQQARVPLGADSGELVALEPTEQPVTGTMSTELLDLNFTSAGIRADDPVNHEQMEAETLALTLNFDATSRRTGNWSLFATEFTLTLPDGSTVPVDGSLIPGLPGSEAGLDTQGLYVRYVVDDPPTGAYVLRFNPSGAWFGDAEPQELTLEFELE